MYVNLLRTTTEFLLAQISYADEEFFPDYLMRIFNLLANKYSNVWTGLFH